MRPDAADNPDLQAMRRFGRALVAFWSRIAMDPHRYFELKYMSELEQARTPRELERIVASLVTLLTDVGPASLQRLDDALTADGLPTVAQVRDAGSRAFAARG